MAFNKYKRDYHYKSDQGDNKNFIWIIIISALVIAAIAYYF